MSDSANKRKYPRVEGKGVAAYLRLNGHNAGCTVQNISVGGVFVKTDRFLPVGTKLAFDLIKPGMKKALTVSGWVVGVITPELSARTRLPQGLRIQFAKLTPTAGDALQELVGSLRRSGDAAPPVLYPIEPKASRRASGPKRAPKSPVAPPPALKPSKSMPSRALAEDPPNSTEVELEAKAEDPSVVRKWFKEGEPKSSGHLSDDQPMIDDSLLDAAGEPEPLPELEEEAFSDSPEAGEEPEQDEEAAEAPQGPNPFEDEDMTLAAEPTQAKARYGQGAASKRPTAPRPPPSRVQSDDVQVETPGDDEEAPEMDELESANRELQRLLERREGEIAGLRAQVTKLEQALKDREEQLQLAKRVLKTNGLG